MTRMEARMARTPTPRVAARQAALREIIETNAPLTVRRAFYDADPGNSPVLITETPQVIARTGTHGC